MPGSMIGGIMAGGMGSRLQAPHGSKGMANVNGRPLLRYVLDQFEEAGISRLALAARPDDGILRRYMSQQEFFDDVIYVDTTPNTGTGGAVRLLLNAAQGHESVISTIDTVAPPTLVSQLINYAKQLSGDVLCVVVASQLIDDSDPLWIASDSDGVVTAIGKDIEPTCRVFGNIRWFSADAPVFVRNITLPASTYRDSLIMKEMIRLRPGSIRTFAFDPVFDIDDPEDVASAERWLLGRAASE